MEYFVLQVRTREEEKFLTLARQAIAESTDIDEDELRVLFPRRKLRIRRRGKTIDEMAAIFPGYVFLETDFEEEPLLPSPVHWALRKLPGFIRFLETNQNIRPLSGRDRELLLHFLRFGEVVERSKVKFDENRRINVVSGPLKGLEGLIEKVDKRKGRAKIRLDMYKDSFLVDLGFDVIAPTEQKES